MAYSGGMSEALALIRGAGRVVALTGAGLSVASGIPSFRGADGLWERYDPYEYASLDSFLANPGKVWMMLKELADTVNQARPNQGHLALTRFQEQGKLNAVITQNVDNLHQEAGTRGVIEFHGNGASLLCLQCGTKMRSSEADLSKLPPRCSCGGVLKPEIVFFGEVIPKNAFEQAVSEVEKADLMLVVGTSARVTPASLMPQLAAHRRVPIIEINMEQTSLTDTLSNVFLEGPAEVILPDLAQGIAS